MYNTTPFIEGEIGLKQDRMKSEKWEMTLVHACA